MEDVIQEYYRTYLILTRRINRFLELKEIWESRAEKTSGGLSFAPKSMPTENKWELAVCKMMDYEDLVDGLVDELVLLRESAKEYMRLTGSEDVRLKEIIHVEQ